MSCPKGCYGCGRKRCSRLRSGDLLYTTPALYGLRDEVLRYQTVIEGELMAMPRSKGAIEGVGLSWSDEYFQVEYPDLFAFMSELVWDDGKARKVGTLTVVAEGKVVKASVHDRDGRRSAWCSAETFAELLKRIDKGLATDSLDWRKDTR